jgi:hypothetical protein
MYCEGDHSVHALSVALLAKRRNFMKFAPTTRVRLAALGKELDAIHFTNILYWKHGTANSREAKAGYHFRLDRVDEIREEFGRLLTSLFPPWVQEVRWH